MISTQQVTFKQHIEFKKIVDLNWVKTKYPTIKLDYSFIDTETYLILADDSGVGNIEDFFADVFDAMMSES